MATDLTDRWVLKSEAVAALTDRDREFQELRESAARQEKYLYGKYADLRSEVQDLLESVDRLAKGFGRGSTAREAWKAEAYRAVLTRLRGILYPTYGEVGPEPDPGLKPGATVQSSDEGAGDREDRDRCGDTEGRVGSEPGSSVTSVAAVTPDCQGGEGPGQPGSFPDFEPVGISDGLPADLIDQAADRIMDACDLDRDGAVAASAHWVAEVVAPLFIAFGREQERARWETRIEKLAAHFDEIHDRYSAGRVRSLLSEGAVQ